MDIEVFGKAAGLPASAGDAHESVSKAAASIGKLLRIRRTTAGITTPPRETPWSMLLKTRRNAAEIL
jgi:hypothetical protein